MNDSERKLKVAVVDDSPENLSLISSILADEYEVRGSKDALHAVDFIAKTQPDLVLLDAVMPGKDGYTILNELQKHADTNEIPVIFLTALTSDKDEERALSLGAVDFIRKPFNPVIVLARLQIQALLLQERRKVEELLSNTLPRKVINDLRTKGEYVPEVVPSASLLFTDFVGFTNRVANLDARQIIDELTDMFGAFDDITLKHGGTRIKTIGDAYFAACGVESQMKSHADSAINIALDIIDYLKNRKPFNGHSWETRIGISSGSVTAGIVGSSKYLYDVFGDPVNIASRVEGTCEPMRVSVCEATIDALTTDSFVIEPRGPVSLKGRGEQELFYVTRA